VVTTPQKVARADVKRTIRFYEKVGVKITGLVANMSYFSCPSCGDKTFLFGEQAAENIAKNLGLKLMGEVPLLPDIAILSDAGKPPAIVNADVKKVYKEMFEKIWKEINES